MKRSQTQAQQRVGFGHLLFRSLYRLMHCEGPQGAAAISFFSLFTLFPLMLCILASTDQVLFIFGARDAVFHTLMELFPGMRLFLQQRLEEMTPPSKELFLTCIALFFWSATWIFDFLESAMNRAWQVTERRTFLRGRLLSLWIIILVSILFFLSTCTTVIVTQLAEEAGHVQKFSRLSPWLFPLSRILLISFGFLFTLAIFFLLYKAVPNTRIRFRDAFRGAVLSSVLWQLANYLFALLMPYLDYSRIYGSIGMIMALLSWVYFSNMIMLWGIHYSAVWKEDASAAGETP